MSKVKLIAIAVTVACFAEIGGTASLVDASYTLTLTRRSAVDD